MGKIVFSCAALGLGSTILFFLLCMVFLGLKEAENIVFAISPGLYVVAFGIIWYPIIKKRLKNK